MMGWLETPGSVGWSFSGAAASAHSPAPSRLSHPIENMFLGPGVIREGFREEADAGFGVAGISGCD